MYPMLNTIIDWERRLEIEEEKRHNHRQGFYVNYLARPQQPHKVGESFFARLIRIFRFGKEPERVSACYVQEHCRETQPG